MSYKEKQRLKRMQEKTSRRYRVLVILCSENHLPTVKRRSYSEIGRIVGFSHTHVRNLAKQFLDCKEKHRNHQLFII